MANLRVLNINAADSRTFKVRFSENLAQDITKSNVRVVSEVVNVPNVEVLSVSILDDILVVNTLPHTPFSRYKVFFESTQSVRFRSRDGRSFLIEDGRSNVMKVLGAENDYNPIRSELVTYVGGQQSVYDLSRETTVRIFLNQLSDFLTTCRADIRQAKNANYLERLITDERKVRRFGPWDRLNQEGAFEVLRVGKTPTNQTLDGVISFSNFPSDPITLQREVIVNEELSLGSGSSGTYNDLILTLTKTPVTKVTSIQIQYNNGDLLDYDIRSLGYQIKDPKYDQTYGRRLVTLEENQIKLSDTLKDSSSFVLPGGSDKIVISYEYKLLGKIIDDNSVEIVEVIGVVRETAPALSTMFSLDYAPVVTSSDRIPESGGIEFLDPFSETPFLTTHPAFSNEIPYREGGLPSRAGDYAVDYETGRIFVYGETNNDGTGNFPPVMNYNYRKTYVPNLDYTYVPEFKDVVASPLRDLIDKNTKINYSFEYTLVPDIDYEANVHVETRNERIDNRLASLDSIYTLHSPVTDVFKIYNETTGEKYNLRRFSSNRIFFDSRNPPRIREIERERVSFTQILNEPLILEQELYNSSSVRIFKFRLLNQNIMGNTEDVIGSSFNTSVFFNQTDVFSHEIYYDAQELSEAININKLTIGNYQINYRSGIIYVGVSSTQSLNVGSVSYKKPTINPKNPHVISVSKVYSSISANFGVSNYFDYISFDDGEIVPTTDSLKYSDERYVDGDSTNPYIFSANTITVTDDIKNIRGIYDAFDLNNNSEPTNFVESASFSSNVITLDSVGITKTVRTVVGSGLVVTVPFISPGIVIGTTPSVIRVTDQTQLIDGSQTITGNTITLSGSSGAVVGDIVDVIYTVVMNGASTPIVDYNRGDFFIDYSYLLDEIIITYEWGDNVIDFRQSNTLLENDTYYVTYLVGALRNSLLENFGSLVRVEELQVFDEELDREVYRDILQGALQTFTKGPTIPAMKELISSVTQIDPRIREVSIWSLGVNYLDKLISEFLGNAELTVGYFDRGLSVRNSGDGVTLPISNNLRLEEGTLELCLIPEWNGIDNDATLTFELYKDGYQLSASNIYIGSSSFNPVLDSNGRFSLNRLDTQSPEGLPGLIFTKPGVFIYYDPDNKQWKILAKDVPQSSGPVYSGNVYTSGAFYDVKFIPNLGDASDVLRSGITLLNFEFHLDGYDAASPDGYDGYDGYGSVIDGYSFDGIQLMSDDNHYFFDFGRNEWQNRFSLYKDGRGYLVFEVWDRGGFNDIMPDRRSVYQVSADIQDWVAGEKHDIAISWILNSSDRRDEMHLYVDGFETPNLARYGNVPSIASTERFGTVVPEQVIGTAVKNSRSSNDLNTTQNSNIVSSSSINFSAEGINIGDQIEIIEQGFSTYSITDVNGYQLTLSSIMPATLSDARFSVNPVEIIVGTEIDIYKNIGVYVQASSSSTEVEIPGTRADIPSYVIERNTLNQRVLKILGNVDIGDRVLLKTFGLNHRRCKDNVYLWSDKAVLRTGLPPPINLDDVVVKTIIYPLTPIGPGNASLVGGNFVATFTDGYTLPSNSLEGRVLEVRVTGDNTDFSTPVIVTLEGTSSGGAVEMVIFNAPGRKQTVNKWKTFSSITVETKPIITSQDSAAFEIKDLYSITEPAGNNLYPVIRFAYRTQYGLSLSGDGSAVVSDSLGYFPASVVGNLLEITAPASVAGLYTIEERINNTTIRLDSAVGTAFSNGTYASFNLNIGRSGFQNGYFFFEVAGFTNTPYELPAGHYEFDYAAYLEVPFDPVEQLTGIIGNSIVLTEPAKAVIDEFRVLNRQLTDTRTGETIGLNEESITTGAQKLVPFTKNQDTLALFHFDADPLVNDSDFYKFANKEYVQSGESVNSRFGHSVVIRDKGLVFDNKGRLDVSNEGMIEFWVSPKFDTYNDPNIRVYFDAAANVVEETVSLTKGRVKVSSSISSVVSVRLVTDTNLQGTDYFDGGRISSDNRTILLNKSLPYQNTSVKVVYVPSSVQGDRITIAKDREGFISLTVVAQGTEYQVRQPVFWPRDSWHRIRASFKFNRQDNNDEIRLFVDGEERGSLLFGVDGLLFGQGLIWGQAAVGGVTSHIYTNDINFTDTIMQFSLGQDYSGNFGAEARFDNLKLSNRSIDPLLIAGQPKDVYFNTNRNFIYPSVEDAFTTFLFDFDKFVEKTEKFAIILDPAFGIFNFDIDIIDSFSIVTGDERVQTVLEALINALKPATSKVGIHYVR